MNGMMKSKFKGGGLVVEEKKNISLSAVKAPSKFTAPSYIDSRPYCLEASNQGAESSCAGFSMAGYIEVYNWKNTHIQEQIDGQSIYMEAKKLDGNPLQEGTTLSAAIEAAKKKNLISAKLKTRIIENKKDVQYALHRYGVCIAGFIITEDWNTVDTKTGYIARRDSTKLGGHAVLLCWYDSMGVGWQNSWGNWGAKGFGRCRWDQFEDQFIYAAVLE